MNIIHLSSPISWRGGEQQLVYLYEELEKQDCSQMIVCPINSELASFCERNNLTYTTYKKRAAVDLLFSYKLKDICVGFKADIVHMHDAHAHTSAVLSSVFAGNKTPFILSRRVDFPVRDSIISKFKYNHPSIKKIICVSDKIKEILDPAIEDKQKSITIRSGIDTSRFSSSNGKKKILRNEFNIPEEHIIIGNASAIAPHKDYYTFVNTAEAFLSKKKNITFIIIGDGPEYKNIQEYIIKKGLKDSIIMTGYRDDITKVLPELDILLFTSETEGLGTTLLDAFASGVPVVSTNAGGIPEIVINKETGLTSNVKDYQSLAKNLDTLIEDKILRERLINNARKKVFENTREITAEKTYLVYKEILSKKQ